MFLTMFLKIFNVFDGVSMFLKIFKNTEMFLRFPQCFCKNMSECATAAHARAILSATAALAAALAAVCR